MASLTPIPKLQFFDANGNPLVGGKLYTYAAGTTTPLATYTDSTGTSANTNPIILDSRGEASVWLANSLYKFELRDSVDALIWTSDNIGNASSYTGTGAIVLSNGATLTSATLSSPTITSATLTSPTLNSATLNSPTLVTPALGTPSAAVLTNATGLPLSTGVTGSLPTALLANAGSELGMRNRVINGNMQVAQRGTSFSGSPFNGYTIDRWRLDRTGTGSTTVVRSANFSYGGNYVVTVSGAYGIGEYQDFKHRIEFLNSADLVGKTVTLSFWASGGTTAGSVAHSVFLNYANSSDNFSSTTNIATNAVAITNTATLFSFTFTNLPVGASNGLEIVFRSTQSVATGTITLSFGSVQLERGATATPIEYIDVATQQARCQRYFISSSFYLARYINGAQTFPVGTLFNKVTSRLTSPTVTLSNITYGLCSGAFVSNITQDSFVVNATSSSNAEATLSATYTVDAEL